MDFTRIFKRRKGVVGVVFIAAGILWNMVNEIGNVQTAWSMLTWVRQHDIPIWLPPTVVLVVGFLLVLVALREAKPGELPQHRPIVIPDSYGRTSEHPTAEGLSVRNPGYTALDVHVPSVMVGQSMYMLTFHGRLAQLSERSNLRFLQTSLRHPAESELHGSHLVKIMEMANVESLTFAILYRDLESRWYASDCKIKRNSQGQLVISLRGQRLIPTPQIDQ